MDEELERQNALIEKAMKGKKPKVGKAGRFFDSANHELEKTKKAHESEASDKEEKKSWSLYSITQTIQIH